MTVRATQKYIRMSARKLRLVADLVRGRDLAEINTVLSTLNKRGARIVNETIRQAVANAVNNMGASEQQLTLKSIMINEGPTYKRVIAKGRGRAGAILKRTSHVQVELNVAELSSPTTPVVEAEKVEAKAEVVETASVVEPTESATQKPVKSAAVKAPAEKKTTAKAPAKKAVSSKKKEA